MVTPKIVNTHIFLFASIRKPEVAKAYSYSYVPDLIEKIGFFK